MKTAVSIPDAIFERAELFARRAKRSRSQLFSDALAEYLARHSGDEIAGLQIAQDGRIRRLETVPPPTA